EIEYLVAVEPGNRDAVVDLPGAVRPQMRLLSLVECDVEQTARPVADVHAGAFPEFGRERREQAGAFERKAGHRWRGGAVRVDLNHARGGPRRLTPDPAAVEDHHLHPGPGQLIGNRGPAGTGDHDV